MFQVYSFVEADGKSFIPPVIKGDVQSFPTYLMSIDGRHYVSVDGKIPQQPPEIKCKGPIDLKSPENKELAEVLAGQSEPVREVSNSRAREYPDLRDQIGAIMSEFQRRQDSGEKLSPELSNMLLIIAGVKDKLPKKNKGLGL